MDTDNILLILDHSPMPIDWLCYELSCEPLKTGKPRAVVDQVAVEEALAELVRDGKAVRDGDGWRRAVVESATTKQKGLVFG